MYERIAIKDVQLACDVLRPVWDETNGADGFVSLEVAPDMAHDEQRSLDGARDFWKRVKRPNVMIKIPGTPEGVGAIEQAIYEGINVNVTLLFSVEAYETVAEAYLNGLERRLNEDKPLERRLGGELLRLADRHRRRQAAAGAGPQGSARARPRSPTRGGPTRASSGCSPVRAGTPCATPARIPSGPCGRRPGSRTRTTPTRSTSTSSSAAHTVNTMPLDTLMAVADHGNVSGPTAQRNPQEALDALAEAGVDLGAITDQLLIDGVAQFEEAMNRLLAGIEERRQGVITGRPATIESRLPSRARRRRRRPGHRRHRAGRRPPDLEQGPVAVGRDAGHPGDQRPARAG